jgi:acetyl-CoA C-acetyltransferase
MANVALAGAYMTHFDEHWDKGLRDIIGGSLLGLAGAVDRNFDLSKIEAIYIGNAGAELFEEQAQLGAIAASCLHKNIPSIRIEAACASGGAALSVAAQAVRAGDYDTVVVLGAEKMTDVTAPSTVTSILSTALDEEWERQCGQTLAGAWAIMARSHMAEYCTTREHLASVVVKNHANGALNPKAQFQRPIPKEAVLRAPFVAEPLTVLDCAPISDGAAALLLTSAQRAHEFTDTPVWILGSGLATDSVAIHERVSTHSLLGTQIAGKRAFDLSKKTVHDIQVAEVHDSFSIGELIAIEDLGFFHPGKAGPATLAGDTALNANISVNPSGGLKARGHPLGATGVAQAVEIFQQLRNEAERRQVRDAQVGLTHNVGGTGGTCVVHILGLESGGA